MAGALGLGNMTTTEYPGVPMVDSEEELRRKVEEVIVPGIIRGLTTPLQKASKASEPGPSDIVCKGTLEDVQEFFHQNLWSDGLPVIPPTIDIVERFLDFTERSPDEVLGVLLPENREATIWNIAVNGVMAGCRPEYMPILVAVVEALADPQFHIQDAGSTPGWEPVIILNGPIVKELDFNYETGVMRVGRQANTSIGRFLRLYMRNVAGLRPGTTDKGTIGATFNVVLAENEDAAAEIGWQPFSVDCGFENGENVVTLQSVAGITPAIYSAGSTPLEHMEVLAEMFGRRFMGSFMNAARSGGSYALLVMSPCIADVFAKAEWTKDDIRDYLHENCKVPAGFSERYAWASGLTNFNLCTFVEEGRIPREYGESKDPDRLVPVFIRPDWIEIVLSGDPGRQQSRGYAQNYLQGRPTSKRVKLPTDWNEKLQRARGKALTG